MTDAFFTTSNGSWFTPTDHARGPWDPGACHAGPPTALLVRAVEALVPHQRLTRITVELIRPVPMAGFRVQAEVRRPGRSVTHTEAEIYDDDRFYARAYALHIRTLDGLEVRTAESPSPLFSDSVEGSFPIDESRHQLGAFASAVDVRYDKGSGMGVGGPSTMWMRTKYPILEDEEPSPFQKIAPLGDCGNGISYNDSIDVISFPNTDLTISLHRDPVGDWFGSKSVSHWQPTGIGLSDSELFDIDGSVGRATQSLILDTTSTNP